MTKFNVTKEPSDEAFDSKQKPGVMEKVCCDCGKFFKIMFTYKSKPQPGHGPYHVIREIVYSNWPKEECLNVSEK